MSALVYQIMGFARNKFGIIFLKTSLRRGKRKHERFEGEQEVQGRIDHAHHTANGPMTLTYTEILV